MVRLSNNLYDGGLAELLHQSVIMKSVYPSIEDYERKVLNNGNHRKDKIFDPEEREIFDRFDEWFTPKCIDPLWILVSGSWRRVDQDVIEDVNEITRYAIGNGYGIMNGGALGVDFISTEAALDELEKRGMDPAEYLSIVLPTDRSLYQARLGYVATAGTSIEARTQAIAISKQLDHIDKHWPETIFDNFPETYPDENLFLEDSEKGNAYRKKVYHGRNGLMAFRCDGFAGFRVNGSEGTTDNHRKAEQLERALLLQDYRIADKDPGIIADYDELRIPEMGKRSYELGV